MSEFSFTSSNSKKTEFSSLLLSDLFHICFFILSHPLYFSYFIFFSPYLLKLLSFLSPLFITTFLLLLLILLTVSPNLIQENSHSELSEYSKVGFLVTTYQTVLQGLQPKVDDENENFLQFEEFEVYKIVFDTSSFEFREDPDEVLELEVKEVCSTVLEAPVEKRLECFLQEKEELENMFGENEEKEEKEVKQQGPESYKVEEEEGKEKPTALMRSESNAMHNKVNDTKVNSQRPGEGNLIPNSSPVVETYETLCSNLGSFGSMRKEKEWRRTLACKLFEERHNVEGGEGMDLLWETYETDSNKLQAKSNTKKGKKSGVEYNEDDDEDEEEVDGQLCCLQALKFSAGKMNLGMGRPNLVKISKALKGIGWLHNVTRHGKKGYH